MSRAAPRSWSRTGLVLLAAALTAGLPVAAAWVAMRAGADQPATLPLLLALAEAPVAALLGAMGGTGYLRWRHAVARRPLLAAASAGAGLAGIFGGVYLHLLFRARAAGAPGAPPIDLLVRVDDFTRAVPLIPAAVLLAAVVGPALAERGRGGWSLAAGGGTGLILALGAGLAATVPVLLATAVGPVLTHALFGLAVVGVALRAGRTAPRP